MSPDVELRSSHAGRLSATPMVSEPDAERRSTEPVVDDTAMSPDPDLAWTSAWCTDLTTTSPEPDFAEIGQCTSAMVRSPEPELTLAARPATRATEMSPDPVEHSRSTASPTWTSPDPL